MIHRLWLNAKFPVKPPKTRHEGGFGGPRLSALSLRKSALGLDDFYFNINPGGHIQIGERFNNLLVRVQDVNHALVDTELELLARVLVDECGTVHRVALELCRKRNRPHDFRIIAFGGFNNLARRIINQFVIVRADAQADLLRELGFFLFCHGLAYIAPKVLITVITQCE